jgi:muramoyltetrapeptide carboxypeptidase
MIQPPYLQVGDTVALACPARSVSPEEVAFAVSVFEGWGLKVKLGETIGAEWHIFGGTDEQRANELSTFFDDENIKAVICARGGYGSVRILDKIDYSGLQRNPKWLVGFSDVTALHSHVNSLLSVASIHACMPYHLPNKTQDSIESLRRALFGDTLDYSFDNHSIYGRDGEVEAEIVGGNLAMLHTIQNSISEIDCIDKILFLEDVDEWLYNVDRMMWNLRRSGKLKMLKGLVVGSFNELKDNEQSFGMTYEEIIWEKVKDYNYPVCFNFPAGHIHNNMAIRFGQKAKLRVGSGVSFSQ